MDSAYKEWLEWEPNKNGFYVMMVITGMVI
jgi:hypothetical protein